MSVFEKSDIRNILAELHLVAYTRASRNQLLWLSVFSVFGLIES